MSLENRRRMYEQLKRAGNLKSSDDSLVKEFGDKEIPKVIEPVIPKKPVKIYKKKGKK